MKRKQLLAVVVAGVAAVALAMPRAEANTILPVSGLARTVTQKRFLPQAGFATANFTVENMSGDAGPDVVVSCQLEIRKTPTGAWTILTGGSDSVTIGGSLREATGTIEIEAPVRATSRFSLRVRCTSTAGTEEPTIVNADSLNDPDALTIDN